ncbi:hypothetical protein SCP_0305590 [Sparassis crispa]|uniref:Uncharacterized protein n=1 Tax=Sparassis crispa TaxID=139825 RepID=A0A401GFA2_9APHY|nr:hypothetical protein SCP_0305590 [Sparassis crispa]GBE80839.1 hypothetical protein SCP_0305590 [Sparassis crispa]
MPKRPPPVQAKEESRFLTVVHPYPAHANMELEDARKNFTYWIAACIGQENILAFFHKPLVRHTLSDVSLINLIVL